MNKGKKIDFVIIWVDGNDLEWQKEKNKYSKNDGDDRIIRYRDWENLKYLFRGIEKFAPWVNRVHFITCGHLPEWLNKDCEKLNIIKHSDYIPSEYLPTFNSHTIELNFHRIEELEEQFVYFNDDMFLTNYVTEQDFFKKGLPCESAVINPITPIEGEVVSRVWYNNCAVINKHFDKNESIKNNFTKWFNFKYGRDVFRTMVAMNWKNFLGFEFTHLPTSLLKSTYKEVWNFEYEKLNEVCLHKFRTAEDVSQYLFKDWQIAKGDFCPRNKNVGQIFDVVNGIDDLCNKIEKQKFKMICINDSEIGEREFIEYKEKINLSFEKILNQKSSFEK